MRERVLLRLGAASSVLGGLLAVVVNVLHPVLPADPGAVLDLIAAHPAWAAIHLGIILAVVLFVGGLVALSASITAEAAGWALARLGLAVALLGGGLMVVSIAIDGFATKAVADLWASASGSGRAQVALVGHALERAQTGLFFAAVGLFFGLAFVLYGLAAVFSTIYPAWLGWVGVAGGAAALVVGTTQFLGIVPGLLSMLHLSALIVTLWILAMGSLMWRRARSLPKDTASR